MIPQKITKKNYSMNNKKRKDVITLKKKNHKLGKIIEDVLKLNIDGYEKKLINFSKSTDFHKKLEKNEDSGIISNPLLLSTSIRQVQRFLPNINILLNTESNFNYNPSRQEHIKFEEKIKKEISFYAKEEKDLREKLREAENQLINLENKIVDCKIDIQALKSLSVSNTKSPLRRAIAKKIENDLNKEENKFIAKSYAPHSPNKFNSPKKLRNSSRQGVSPLANSEFNTRLNIKLMEEEKKCKEKEKKAELNITMVINEKENEHKKLNNILEELKIVNNNKKVLIDQLYKHYLSLLKEGKDSRKEGLAWIIMEIFYLNKKILASNFPRYLDNDCIHYLFKMANLNIKIIQLENQVKNKRDYLNTFVKNYNINNYFMKYFYDDSEDNPNNYEYNKKQLSSLISTFSTKFNRTNIINNSDQNLLREKINNGKNISITEESNNSSKIKEDSIFKTSKTNTNFNNNSNNKEKSFDYMYKNSKKRIYRINEFQSFFDQNNKSNNSFFKGKEALKSNEYQLFSNLSNELFSLKQEKEKLRLSEMDRIFKEFQKNDYKQRFQIEKKTVISALIGEDNLETELFKQAKREKEYMYKMNKIQLFQNKYQGHKSFH